MALGVFLHDDATAARGEEGTGGDAKAGSGGDGVGGEVAGGDVADELEGAGWGVERDEVAVHLGAVASRIMSVSEDGFG